MYASVKWRGKHVTQSNELHVAQVCTHTIFNLSARKAQWRILSREQAPLMFVYILSTLVLNNGIIYLINIGYSLGAIKVQFV